MRPIALKLHKQFGHPTAINLIKLILSAGIDNSDLEREIDGVPKIVRYVYITKRLLYDQ